MKEKKPKSLFERFAAGTKELLAHPYVQTAGDIGSRVLEISASLADNRNAMSIGGAALSGVSVLSDAFNVSYISPMTHWTNKRKLTKFFGALHRFIIRAGILEEFQEKIVYRTHDTRLAQIEFSEESSIFYEVQGGDSGEAHRAGGTDSLLTEYYLTKDFEYDEIRKFFWTKFPTGISLSHGKSTGGEDPVEIAGLPANVRFKETDESVSTIVQQLTLSKELNISRSYLIYGEPGTGKTCFVEKISSFFGHKFIKVDSSFLDAISANELETIFDILAPEIILFDDFDRIDIESTEGKLLFITENLKRKYPKIVFFATVNHKEILSPALLRPGRFDEKIYFGISSVKTTIEMLKDFCEQYQVGFDVDEVAARFKGVPARAIGEGLTMAECKEFAIRKKLLSKLSDVDIVEALLQEREAANQSLMDLLDD